MCRVVDAIKNIKSDPLKYTIFMCIVFQFSIVTTQMVFDNVYVTAFASLGILFLGYMGYITYIRDQERKAPGKTKSKGQAAAKK